MAIDFELMADQELLCETSRRFLENTAPLTRVRSLATEPYGFDPKWWEEAAALGWVSMFVPERWGGGSVSGSPIRDAVLIAEELGRAVAPGPFVPVNVVASSLAVAGSDEQQAELLPGLASGEMIATWAIAEHSGWDGPAIATTARLEGDEVVLDGTKAYVEAADAAGSLLVVAKTGKGLSQVLVPTATSGVTVTTARGLDLVRRFSEVRFDGVRVPLSAIVGQLGNAADEVERLQVLALLLQTAETVGVIDRVFEITLEYSNDRYAFGRSIGSYQALKHRLADLLWWLETAKGTTVVAAKALSEQTEAAPVLVSSAKVYVAERSLELIQDCVQLHGGIGVTYEHDLHLYLRRATVNRSTYGTPEEHREHICTLLGV